MGFFTDAYGFFYITTITNLLGRIYYFDGKNLGVLPPNVTTAVIVVALCGTLAGKMFFGWMGDKLVRNKIYGIMLILMVITSIASGLSFSKTIKAVTALLYFFRFWLGFGRGYPLSATIMSEYENKRTRGAFMEIVFAMQGFGILVGGTISLIMSTGFLSKYYCTYKSDPLGLAVTQDDYVWWIILTFGALPLALTYYWRMKMPQIARYTTLIAKDQEKAVVDMSKILDLDIYKDWSGVWFIFQRVYKVTRLASTGYSKHMVFLRHHILQPNSIPKGHIQGRGMEFPSPNNERH